MTVIRGCRTADVPDVLTFLDTHWKRGHIFTVDRSLFEWQHARADRPGEYSVALALRETDNAIVGLLGYIPTRRFDPALAADNMLWLALWKVREDVDSAGLGLRLVNYVMEQEPHTSAGVLGFNPVVRPIYRALGFNTGELEHYVLRNPDVTRFELASFGAPMPSPVCTGALTASPLDDATFDRVVGLNLTTPDGQAPRKTAAYFKSRYLRHPIYRYRCFMLNRSGVPVALLATRVATHAGARALRIVDYVGPPDAVAELGAVLLAQLRAEGAEYADVYNSGIDRGLFERAGFSRVDPEGEDVVPDHFEPFERRNVRILFAVKGTRPAVLFKGDADQDRPSRPAA